MGKNLKKSFWSDAAKGGAIIGLAIVLIDALGMVVGEGKMGTIIGLLRVVALVLLIMYLARNRGAKHGSDGFSYGQSMKFILTMMLFVGFIYGIGQWLLLNYLFPSYLDNVLDNVMSTSLFTSEMETMIFSMIESPVFWVFVGVLGMLIYGGIIGLIVSISTKRNADPFGENEEVDK